MDHLIIATDFSETAGNAASYAAQIAPFLGIRQIIVYHAYGQVPVSAEVPMPVGMDGAEHEENLTVLGVFEQTYISPYLNTSIQVSRLTDSHFLPFGIESLCKKYDPLLVVAGTTGKSAMEKLVMGSNTVHLATLCPAPLLIVSQAVQFRRIRKIMFACDLEKVEDSSPTEEISTFSSRLNAQLLILNITPEGRGIKPQSIPEQYALHKLLDHLQPEYHYEESKHVVSGIIKYAEQENADLIITVPKSQGFFESIFHKSVTKRLALNKDLEVPLLVLREKE